MGCLPARRIATSQAIPEQFRSSCAISLTLTFASYNIHKAVGTDGVRDADRIITVLRELDADVIALQEVDRRLGDRASVLSRAALDDTPWRPAPVNRRPRSLGWHGNSLLVRRSIEIAHAEALELPTLEPRGAVCAELQLDRASFCVVGTHLDLSGLRRRDQIRALLTYFERKDRKLPCVLLGDFNQWGRETGAMREFKAPWQALAPGPSFPSRRPLARLDRIVASGEWHVLETGVHHSAMASRASDHLPVWCTAKMINK